MSGGGPESKWLSPPMIFNYVMAGIGGVLAFNTFQNDTANAVERIEYHVQEHEAKQRDRLLFRQETSYRMDILCRANPECDRRFSNLRVPE